MAAKELTILDEGDRMSATWLNKLRWIVWANRVTVARDCGLTMVESPGGKVIGYTPEPTVLLGITTTSILGRVGKTVKYGTVQPYALVGNTLVIAGPTIQVGNWTGSVIPTNIWIQYIVMYKQNILSGTDCSGVAP